MEEYTHRMDIRDWIKDHPTVYITVIYKGITLFQGKASDYPIKQKFFITGKERTVDTTKLYVSDYSFIY